jgi:hypothetical protein
VPQGVLQSNVHISFLQALHSVRCHGAVTVNIKPYPIYDVVAVAKGSNMPSRQVTEENNTRKQHPVHTENPAGSRQWRLLLQSLHVVRVPVQAVALLGPSRSQSRLLRPSYSKLLQLLQSSCPHCNRDIFVSNAVHVHMLNTGRHVPAPTCHVFQLSKLAPIAPTQCTEAQHYPVTAPSPAAATAELLGVNLIAADAVGRSDIWCLPYLARHARAAQSA